MNKIKLLYIFILLGIIFSFNDVFAISSPIKVGNIDINPGETKNIYGGTVSFIDDVLTLNNVNITDTYRGTINGSDGYFSIYTSNDTVNIKLVGNNTITSNYTDGVLNSYYNGIAIDTTNETYLNISGDGTLNFNVKDYCVIDVLYAWHIKIGSGVNTDGPTLNFNINLNKDKFNNGCIIGDIESILQSNININIDNACDINAFVFGSNANIVKSNINIYIKSWGSTNTFRVNDNTSFKSNNILVKMEFDDWFDSNNKDSNVVFSSGSYERNFRLLNGNSYFEAPIICDWSSTLEVGPYEGNIDAFFVGKFDGNLELDNSFWPSPANIRYTSKTTKDALINTYDENDLKDYKYIRITDNVVDYSLIEGNNQSLKELNEFKFKVSGSRVLLENIMLDDIVLSNDDYIYDYEGNIEFTSSGLNKIKGLFDGTHQVHINYYNGKSIDVDFTYTDIYKNIINFNNPDTIDNIIIYIVGLLISLTGFTLLFVKTKRRV